MAHPLLELLLDAADGSFPPADGRVSVVPPLDDGPVPGMECSVGFTGHAVVATALPAAAVQRRADGFGGSFAPEFLTWLAGPGGWIGVVDATLVARGRGGPATLPERFDLDDTDRVRHARAIRSGVRTYGDERGLVTLGDGLAGRRELSIEVVPDGRGQGAGRSLLADALALVPRDEPVFAAVSPGNARSLRAFLAAGFVPIGSEVLVRPGRVS